MSKDKTVVSSKEGGAHYFKDKGHLKSDKKEGAHDPGKHEKPFREQGTTANTKKPLVHSEQVGVTHSGRALPVETSLKDSAIITKGSGHSGRLAKRNE